MRICETCGKQFDSGEVGLWVVQVMKGTKSEFHYYCSEKHADEGMKNLPYPVIIGEIPVPRLRGSTKK